FADLDAIAQIAVPVQTLQQTGQIDHAVISQVAPVDQIDRRQHLGTGGRTQLQTTQAEGQGLSALVPEAPIIIGTLRLAINQIAQTGYRAVDKDPLQSAITRTRAG